MSNLMPLVHLIAVVLASLIIVARGVTLFKGVEGHAPNPQARVVFVACQHLAMTVVALSGLWLLNAQNFVVEAWFYAKAVLFFVVLSSLAKAYKKDESILLVQRRGGWVIACIAWCAILALVWIQPVFS